MDNELPENLKLELEEWLNEPEDLEDAIERAESVECWGETARQGLQEDVRARDG